MRHRQTGITFIGWLFLLLPVAIVAFAVIRLVPVYLNYSKVTRAITQTAAGEHGSGGAVNPAAVRTALEKRFDVESIDFPKVSDVEIKRTGEHWSLGVTYDDVVSLFGGISLTVHFEKRADIE